MSKYYTKIEYPDLPETLRRDFEKSLSEEKAETRQEEPFDPFDTSPLNNDKDLSIREIMDMELKPRDYIVSGILPEGLAMLVAKPKYGKSFMALDAAIAVSTGTPFLGFPTRKGSVLYLDLEEDIADFNERYRRIAQGRDPGDDLKINFQRFIMEGSGRKYKADADGLARKLTRYLNENPGTVLIIIDTLEKVRGEQKREESAYARDYREASVLKNIALHYHCCILLVHHARKLKDNTDPLDNISGTVGLSGSCDTLLVLQKEKREADQAQLFISGKRVRESELVLSFDKDTCIWRLVGNQEEVDHMRLVEKFKKDPISATMKNLVQTNYEWRGSAKDLIMEVERRGITYAQHTSQEVNKNILAYVKAGLFSQIGIAYNKMPNGSTSPGIHSFRRIGS